MKGTRWGTLFSRLGGRLAAVQIGPSPDQKRVGLLGVKFRAEFSFDNHTAPFWGSRERIRPRNIKIEHFSLIFWPRESWGFGGVPGVKMAMGGRSGGTGVWYGGFSWNGFRFIGYFIQNCLKSLKNGLFD